MIQRGLKSSLIAIGFNLVLAPIQMYNGIHWPFICLDRGRCRCPVMFLRSPEASRGPQFVATPAIT